MDTKMSDQIVMPKINNISEILTQNECDQYMMPNSQTFTCCDISCNSQQSIVDLLLPFGDCGHDDDHDGFLLIQWNRLSMTALMMRWKRQQKKNPSHLMIQQLLQLWQLRLKVLVVSCEPENKQVGKLLKPVTFL